MLTVILPGAPKTGETPAVDECCTEAELEGDRLDRRVVGLHIAGRQPYIVYGLIRTADVASKVAAPLISNRTSLLARHGMRPSFGIARNES